MRKYDAFLIFCGLLASSMIATAIADYDMPSTWNINQSVNYTIYGNSTDDIFGVCDNGTFARDNGTFVQIAGDNMTGNLNTTKNISSNYGLFDGRVGIGTTDPLRKLQVIDDTLALSVIRKSTGTNVPHSVFSIEAQTSANMVDGYGPAFSLQAQDATSGLITYAAFNAVRDGADDQAKFVVTVQDGGGAPKESFSIGHTGLLSAQRRNTATNSIQTVGGFKAITSANMVDGYGPAINLQAEDSADTAVTGVQLIAERDGSDSDWAFVVKNRNTATGLTENLWVGSDGNVGINTTSPKHLLDVGGMEGIGAPGNLGIKSDSGAWAIRIEENSGVEGWHIGVDVDGDLNFDDSNTGIRLTFQDETGNIGIGTTSPGRDLEIYDSSPALRIRDSGATAGATTAFIEFGGTDATAWNRTGYIGDASSGNADIYLRAEVGDLYLGDSSGVTVLNLQGGNVGIGTTDPNATLHVDGDGNFTGNVTSENVFIPQYIFSHTNATIPVLGAGLWTNITFDQEVVDIKQGIAHDATGSMNQTFIIMKDGIYDVDFDIDVEDTSPSASDIDVAGRLIFTNGTEVIGSVFETDITKQGAEVELSHNFLAEFKAGEQFIFQFVADDAQVQISTHGTFGSYPESATILMMKIANL